MWTILILLVLCILSVYFYLPLPVIVILFAALISGTVATMWFASKKQQHAPGEHQALVPVRAVVEPDTDPNS